MNDKQRRLEIVVGFTILLAFIITIGVVLWSKGSLLSRHQQMVTLNFDRVGRLTKSDLVTVSGVEIGRVSSIALQGDSVLVTARLTRDVQLKADARARIISSELMGGRQVEIQPGNAATPLPGNAVIRGEYVPGIANLAEVFHENRSNVQHLISDLETSAASLRVLLGDTLGTARRLNSAIRDFASTAARLDSFLDQYSSSLAVTVENLEQSSNLVRNFLTSEGQHARDLLAAGRDLTRQLQQLSDSTQLFINKINSPNSSLGRLLQDDTLYTKFNQSIITFDSLLNDFQTNPGKYLDEVNLKLRLF
ncbi:MAG TPA: MlaD family protein [bacterium]|nr:MlaD family protein [bacterium]